MKNKIRYEIGKMADIDEIVKAATKFFFMRNPLSVSCQFVTREDEVVEGAYEFIKHTLEDNVSIIAKDERTGKIIGGRLCAVETRESRAHARDSIESFPDGKWKEHITFLETFYAAVDVFSMLTSEKVLDFVAAFVDEEYEGQGIFTEMLHRSIKLGKDLGCTAVKVVAVNVKTSHVFAKLGFKELSVHYGSKYVSPYTGEKPFKNFEPIHDRCVLYGKILND